MSTDMFTIRLKRENNEGNWGFLYSPGKEQNHPTVISKVKNLIFVILKDYHVPILLLLLSLVYCDYLFLPFSKQITPGSLPVRLGRRLTDHDCLVNVKIKNEPECDITNVVARMSVYKGSNYFAIIIQE